MTTPPRTPDRLLFRRLELPCRIGAHSGEADLPQPVWVALELEVDLTEPAATDRLEDTVDYGRVAEAVAAVVARPEPYVLLEHLAASILAVSLGFARVLAAEVTVEKARPPLGPAVGHIAIRLRRERTVPS